MLNQPFQGAREIGKPDNMTDEQCSSVMAAKGKDTTGYPLDKTWVDSGQDVEGFPFYVTHWQPSKEDLEALNAGRGMWIKHVGAKFAPLWPFTIDQDGNPNV